ncbi:hypothetical protein SAMN06295967_102251 [Belliella buryatensis]|uniref:Outer membrane protein beta-barrel domain-containing protein n=1 Tax=Belliella buryatensis TaxID=1500549 RepID=A0A239BAR2_9BACT|nr:hypothetical protein [Belliella buryatensis]SNS05027.1 hypothetical protein SAMN06295967_102251 [Belliella buryatensis]
MKKYLLSFLLFQAVIISSSAQNLDLSLGFGSYRVPNQVEYELPRMGFNMNFGMLFQINDNWEMGTAINHSVFNYERVSLANTPLSFGSFITSATVITDHLYFTFRRKVKLPLKLEGSVGLGLGGFVEKDEYYAAQNFDEERGLYTGLSWVRDTKVGLHFPVTYSIKKILSNKVHLGIEGGIFLDSKLNTRGIFIGPKAGIFL